MEKELLETLKQIVDDFEDLNRGIVTQASINRAKRAIKAAQPTLAPDFAETCEYCSKPKNSPNYAYHVCVGHKAGNANR